jgi:hypothetical protein
MLLNDLALAKSEPSHRAINHPHINIISLEISKK